jgi:SAM-dependent methyltransferase
VLSLGTVPLADRFPAADEDLSLEPRYPLSVLVCEDCHLVQLRETVAPEVLFASDYPYYSSFSTGWLRHCQRNAEELIQSRTLGPSSLVVELASNDGYMLKNFVDRGIPVLGIDPAEGPANKAQEQGVRTLQQFFSLELAEQLLADGQAADVILANNVLAHVADLSAFVEGIRTLLKPDGMAVIEVPYVRDLVDHCEFDTIYHEHLCYYSVSALDRLFTDRGLCITEARRLATHGGSLRLYITHGNVSDDQPRAMMQDEQRDGLQSLSMWNDFSNRVAGVQNSLLQGLRELHAAGHRIWGYGAAAKGTTLLNTASVDDSLIERIVDRNIHKHGRLMPGVHIPIAAPETLLQEMPDYLLLLAWNHRDEIIEQQSAYQDRGGRFIVPVPEFAIL